MSRISQGLSALGASLVLSACAPQDSQNMLRKMNCYGVERIIPSEIQEIEKSIQGKVSNMCGGYTVVIDSFVISPITQSVEFTVVIGTQGEMLSIKQDIAKFLIPEVKKEVPKVPEQPETKYKVQ